MTYALGMVGLLKSIKKIVHKKDTCQFCHYYLEKIAKIHTFHNYFIHSKYTGMLSSFEGKSYKIDSPRSCHTYQTRFCSFLLRNGQKLSFYETFQFQNGLNWRGKCDQFVTECIIADEIDL